MKKFKEICEGALAAAMLIFLSCIGFKIIIDVFSEKDDKPLKIQVVNCEKQIEELKP